MYAVVFWWTKIILTCPQSTCLLSPLLWGGHHSGCHFLGRDIFGKIGQSCSAALEFRQQQCAVGEGGMLKHLSTIGAVVAWPWSVFFARRCLMLPSPALVSRKSLPHSPSDRVWAPSVKWGLNSDVFTFWLRERLTGFDWLTFFLSFLNFLGNLLLTSHIEKPFFRTSDLYLVKY